MKTTFHLHRLLLPLAVIFYFQVQFEDTFLGMIYGCVMAFVAARFFPLFTIEKDKKDETENE